MMTTVPALLGGANACVLEPLTSLPWLASPQTGNTSLGLVARNLLWPEVIHVGPGFFSDLMGFGERNHYCSGTSLRRVLEIILSGGSLSPDISYFTPLHFRARTYARIKARRDFSPGVVLSFPKSAIDHLVTVSACQPNWTVSGDIAEYWDGGMAEFHVARHPVPLSLLFPKTKQAIMSWLEQRAGVESPVQDKFIQGAELFRQGLQV